jgi:hypothetical protein
MEMGGQFHTPAALPPEEVLVLLGGIGPEIRFGYGGEARMNELHLITL